jgi:hypothetical protein
MKGYGTAPYGVVRTLNGVDIQNLDQMVTILRDSKDEFLTIEPYGRHETIVFRRGDMETTTEDVLNDEGIRYQASDDLMELWEAKPEPAPAAN